MAKGSWAQFAESSTKMGSGTPAGPHADVPHKAGLSGPQLIVSIPDPTLPNYIARFDADDLASTFAKVGIQSVDPRPSCFGNGHTVRPGTIDMAIRDGELIAMLPGIHAWRTHPIQPKPYVLTGQTIQFEESDEHGDASRQEFEGGIILTLGPSEVGFAYNVPTECESADMGRGVILIPPGTWIIRAPILVARENFEATTTGRKASNGRNTYIQELNVGVMDLAKPRLVYVPYNHSAMFIDGTSSVICDQGFHWANPGIEIAGPWPQHEERFTHSIEAKTLDNMKITIEAECWVQMVNPERYVKVAGKHAPPQKFVEDKLTAKVKQHVAQINALQIRSVEVPGPTDTTADEGDFEFLGDATLGVPALPAATTRPAVPSAPTLPPAAQPEGQGNGQKPENVEDIMVTEAEQDTPSEFQVFNRMKSLLDEVRGFVDGRHSTVESLAHLVQQAISRAGLQLISLAALSVSLPPNIASQIQQANEEQIKAQTEQATNHAKAQKHIAEKYAEIRKKKADREEETKDAENQVTLQRTKARLAEAEEFAKRQAKRAEQKVEQSLELQALEHKMVREQTRIDNELRILEKEAELLARQEDMEAQRLALAKKVQLRSQLEADVEAYKVTVEARAERERVNQQTLVDAIMAHMGRPLEGSKILTINGGGAPAAEDGEGKQGSMGMLPQMIALREILAQTQDMEQSCR